MAQNQGVIRIQKPYLGWIPTLSGTTINHALESSLGTNSQSLQIEPSPMVQDYSYSSGVMINRPGYEGHISAGPQFSTVTDSNSYVNGLALNAAVAVDGNTYVLLDSNRYVFFGSATASPSITVNDQATPAGNAGIHSGHSGFSTILGDITTFPVTQGTQGYYTSSYTFISWTDGTDGDIAQCQGNNVAHEDWLTGTHDAAALVTGVPHPLFFNYFDKYLYFGDGQMLRGVDPLASGNSTDKELDLAVGWIVQGICQYQDFIAVIAYRKNSGTGNFFNPAQISQSKLILWDGFSPVANFTYDIRDNFASNVMYDGSDLWILTYGKNNTTKLKKFNGSGFDIEYETANAGGFPGGQTSPNPCFGAMDTWLNEVTWTNNSNGMINAYGSPASEYPSGFHSPALTAGINGMCKNLWENVLFIGNKNGNSYSIQYSNLATYSTGSEFFSALYPLPTNSTITYVKLYNSYWPNANNFVNVGIFKDYAFPGFSSATDSLSWQAMGGTNSYYLSKSQTIDNVNAFYLGIYFGGSVGNQLPIIREIEVGYSFTDENI